MNEIEKLYENAGIKIKIVYYECHRGRSSMRCCPINSDDRDEECSSCFFRDKMKEVYEYPPFTAEKQLELIKRICPSYPLNYYVVNCFEGYTFEEGLANCMNNLWEGKALTEEEKQQIKEILK